MIISEFTLKILVAFGCMLLAMGLEAIFLPQILYVAYKKRLYDLPNGRKVHTDPTPRLAGITFMPILVLVLGTSAVARLLYMTSTVVDANIVNQTIVYILFAMGLMMLYLIGAVDDLVGIDYKSKFIVQIAASILPSLGGFWINNFGGLFGIYAIPPLIGIPLTIVLFVYIINAVNLIDGIDGLSSGLSIISLVLMGIACFNALHYSMGLMSVTMIGVLLVFFKYNVFHKGTKKLFMGDSGSMSLGYVLGLLLVHFWNERVDWDPFELRLNITMCASLLIPLLDVIHVVIGRLLRHKNPFLPDKTHIHHRLMRAGFSPHATLIALLIMSLFIIGVNLAITPYIGPNMQFVVNIAIWLAINAGIAHKTRLLNREKSDA